MTMSLIGAQNWWGPNPGALSIHPEILELSKWGEMVMLWKFPWEVYRKSETTTVKILEIPGIPGGKSNETEIPGKTFSKIWMYLLRLTPFPNILESIQGSHPLVVVVFDYQ